MSALTRLLCSAQFLSLLLLAALSCSVLHVQPPGTELAGVGLDALVRNVIVKAVGDGCDVYTALDVMDISSVFKPCRFMPGNGLLHYYLYSYHAGR